MPTQQQKLEKNITDSLYNIRFMLHDTFKNHQKLSNHAQPDYTQYLKIKKLFKSLLKTIEKKSSSLHKKPEQSPIIKLCCLNIKIGIIQCQMNLAPGIAVKNKEKLKEIDNALRECGEKIKKYTESLTQAFSQALFTKHPYKSFKSFYTDITDCSISSKTDIPQLRAIFHYNYAMKIVEKFMKKNQKKILENRQQYIKSVSYYFKESAKFYGEANQKQAQQETLTHMEEQLRNITQQQKKQKYKLINQATQQSSSGQQPIRKRSFSEKSSSPSTLLSAQHKLFPRQLSLPTKITTPVPYTKKIKLSAETPFTFLNKSSVETNKDNTAVKKAVFKEQVDILLTEIDIHHQIDIEKALGFISWQNEGKPILIKHGTELKLFGCPSSGQWQVTTLGVLNDESEFQKLYFPPPKIINHTVELRTRVLHNDELTNAMLETIKTGHAFSEIKNENMLENINYTPIVVEKKNKSILKHINDNNELTGLQHPMIASEASIDIKTLLTDSQEATDITLKKKWKKELIATLKSAPPCNSYAMYSQLFYTLAKDFISSLSRPHEYLPHHIVLTTLSWLQIASVIAELDPNTSQHCMLLKKNSVALYQYKKMAYQDLIKHIQNVTGNKETDPYETYTYEDLQKKLTNQSIQKFFLSQIVDHLFAQKVLISEMKNKITFKEEFISQMEVPAEDSKRIAQINKLDVMQKTLKNTMHFNKHTLHDTIQAALHCIEKYNVINKQIDAAITEILAPLETTPKNIDCVLYAKLFCALASLYLVKENEKWLAENNLLFNTNQLVSRKKSISTWLLTARQLIDQAPTSIANNLVKTEIEALCAQANSQNIETPEQHNQTTITFFQQPLTVQADQYKALFQAALTENLQRLNAIHHSPDAAALTLSNINELINRLDTIVKTVYKETMAHHNDHAGNVMRKNIMPFL